MERLATNLAGDLTNWWELACEGGLGSSPLVVFLQGQLGAGKTTLVRGILRRLGVSDAIKSPTYSLIETYDLVQATLHHCDCYRVTVESELEDAGFRDLFMAGSVWFIEWPERANGWFPTPDLSIRIEQTEELREVIVAATSHLGRSVFPGITAKGAL